MRFHKSLLKPLQYSLTIVSLGISGLVSVSDIASVSTHATENPSDFSVSITPTLAITADKSVVNLNLTPTSEGAFDTANLSVNVGTNNPTGFTLTMSSSNTNLVNARVTDDGHGNNTIPTLTAKSGNTPYTRADFSMNTWGISTDATNFYPMVASKELVKVNTPINASITNLTLAAKADLSKVSGDYSGVITFSATVNPLDYNITYNAGTTDTVTGMPSPNPVTGTTAAGAITFASAPTRDGYNFLGWCSTLPTDDTCSGTLYNPGDSYNLYDNPRTTTVYAVWEKNQPKLIDFTFYGRIATGTPKTWTAQAEEGMTFAEWVLSDYYNGQSLFMNNTVEMAQGCLNGTNNCPQLCNASMSYNIFTDLDSKTMGDAVYFNTIITNDMIFGYYSARPF